MKELLAVAGALLLVAFGTVLVYKRILGKPWKEALEEAIWDVFTCWWPF